MLNVVATERRPLSPLAGLVQVERAARELTELRVLGYGCDNSAVQQARHKLIEGFCAAMEFTRPQTAGPVTVNDVAQFLEYCVDE